MSSLPSIASIRSLLSIIGKSAADFTAVPNWYVTLTPLGIGSNLICLCETLSVNVLMEFTWPKLL
ncbi:hypothetical protein [Paenibacillus sp. AR247]|uniref:hypothetical protein n=1 Tax=Paenibacillus sp. AR247 TaxID=1631599 RepID=UPI0021584FF6|nr:hypothetical protein [Paenibacillus sp. AR247]